MGCQRLGGGFGGGGWGEREGKEKKNTQQNIARFSNICQIEYTGEKNVYFKMEFNRFSFTVTAENNPESCASAASLPATLYFTGCR